MEAACTGKDWRTCGGKTASCSSWRRARAKTGGPVVVRLLDAHHGGGVHWQRLVDMWWLDIKLLIMEAACTGKDWWTCGGQTASCSSWRRRARAKTGGYGVVRQQVAHHGRDVHGQRMLDLWWSDR